MISSFLPRSVCPHWARFIFRSDGNWMAWCSELGCKLIEEQRPGTLENTDFHHEEKCLLGFSDYAAQSMPCLIWGLRLEVIGYCYYDTMSDAEWSRLVDDFIANGPRGDNNYDVSGYV